MTTTFRRAVWISLALHAVLVALIVFRAITLPTENIQIKNAIRVDVVGLPQKTVEPPAEDPPATKPAPPAAAAAEAPAVPKVVLKPKAPDKKDVAKSETNAIKRLRAFEKLNELKAEPAKSTPRPAVRGNQLAAGNALSGLERLDYDKYFSQVRAQVFSHWSLPTWMADANFKATVTVTIDEHGVVLKKVVRQSSGNEMFDNHALEAIDASSPFPAPPARLAGLLSTTGFNFNFPQ